MLIQSYYSSLLGLVSQQLSINPLAYLHPWNSLTHFQRRHIDIQLTFVHQIRDNERWRYHLTIFTIKQCLSFTQYPVQLLTYHAKINDPLDVVIEWQVQILVLFRILELWHFLILAIFNKIHQTFYTQILQLFLAVWWVNVALLNKIYMLLNIIYRR